MLRIRVGSSVPSSCLKQNLGDTFARTFGLDRSPCPVKLAGMSSLRAWHCRLGKHAWSAVTLAASMLFSDLPLALFGSEADAVPADQVKEIPEDFPRFVVPGFE